MSIISTKNLIYIAQERAFATNISSASAWPKICKPRGVKHGRLKALNVSDETMAMIERDIEKARTAWQE